MRALSTLACVGLFMASWYLTVHPKISAEARQTAGLPRKNPAGDHHAAGDRAAAGTRAVKESSFKARRMLMSARELFAARQYADCARTLDLALSLARENFLQQEVHYLRSRCRRGAGDMTGAVLDLRDACLKGNTRVCEEYRMAQQGRGGRTQAGN